jgi:hypothetical protein
VHHIGYWTGDIAAEARRLDALGYPGFATAESEFAGEPVLDSAL